MPKASPLLSQARFLSGQWISKGGARRGRKKRGKNGERREGGGERERERAGIGSIVLGPITDGSLQEVSVGCAVCNMTEDYKKGD